MKDLKITSLRSIDLGVTDTDRSLQFYSEIWGLKQVSSRNGVYYLKARNAEHHAVSLRRMDTVQFLGVALAAKDDLAVEWLRERAGQKNVEVEKEPSQLEDSEGGGYGFTLIGPENLRVTVSSGVAQSESLEDDVSKPYKLTHVVLNSADVPAQKKLFMEVLDFRLSDSTQRMDFLRCGSDHHTIALAHGNGLSLNHAAFEMESIDALMYGAGRLIEHGYRIEWGLGRHGPGNNVFSYFIDPDGFVVEYTTDMQQIEENSYMPQDPKYWASFPKRPCRWGVAREPSERLMAAMAGRLASR